VHTTVADYVKRPRFKYHHPNQGNNYERVLDEIRAVPPGEGFTDYSSFLHCAGARSATTARVAFEMCSPCAAAGASKP